MLVYLVLLVLEATCVTTERSCMCKEKCGINETRVACKTICPPRFCNISYTDFKCDPDQSDKCVPGCDCIEDYLRDNSGQCVYKDDCPTAPECGLNEVKTDCKNESQFCNSPSGDDPQNPSPCQPGCNCIEGFLRDENGVCIPEAECPEKSTCENKCGVNEKWVPCKTLCPPQSCNISFTTYLCEPKEKQKCEPGCDCVDNYLRDNNNQCILNDDCPPRENTCENKCGVNEKWVPCKTTCPPQSCNISFTTYLCDPREAQKCIPGCDCIENYLRDNNEQCILNDDCFSKCNGDRNATYKKCPNPCQPSCENPMNMYCKRKCDPFGCQCLNGYLLYEGKCILPKDCPGGDPCGKNRTYGGCSAVCPNDYCPDSDSRSIPVCDAPMNCPAGCVCKKNYSIKSTKDNTCVLSSDCPEVTCTRQNEVWNRCPKPCFSDSCKDINKTEDCDITYGHYCQPQCVCEEGFRRNNSDICVPIEECPPPTPVCGENEEPSDCKQECPPQTCAFDNTKQACKPGPCQPGCNCVEGYLRDANGTCIPKSQCPPKTPDCNNRCTPTCLIPNPPNCPTSSVPNNLCNCTPGYILSEQGGRCVKLQECQQYKSCNGDKNATFRECPNPCPSTCEAPDNPLYCKRKCEPYGCQCKYGYILRDGKCVLPQDCPGGDPCGSNRTFYGCSFGCPDNDCPTDDSLGIIACSPPFVCQSGCSCKGNYSRKSYNDTACILSADCPPVKCTRQNEEWNRCPPPCFSESCRDIYKPKEKCEIRYGPYCRPQCVCKDGYKRNNSNICVLIKQCPPSPLVCGANEVPSNCKQVCPPQTCAFDPRKQACKPGPCRPGCNCIEGYLRDKNGTCIPKNQCPPKKPVCNDRCTPTCLVPNPPDCPDDAPNNPCGCPTGYILSQRGGKCVKYQECQEYKSCNDDKNATFRECPNPCQSTCEAPDTPLFCKRKCEPYGCECNYGYILRDGKCVLPQDCPGGEPCRNNRTFDACSFDCPSNDCPTDDSRGIIACSPPFVCRSGCSCKGNYSRKSYNDTTCILSSDCPPVKCTRQNEEWNRCPPPCFSDSCLDVNKTQEKCNIKYDPYCRSRCVCKEGYKRNSSGICVPIDQCPLRCGINEVSSPCKIVCPPQTCANTYSRIKVPCFPSPCKSGCNCISGYLRNSSGVCVPQQQCPEQCNGDKNATYQECPNPCPPTCEAPDRSQGCKKKCEGFGCQCNYGYILRDGKCVLPGDCPGGDPCRNNKTFVGCTFNCPTNYCPKTDTRAMVACDAPWPCYPGCACKINHLKKNGNDTSCVLSSDCPPVKCTRQNEVWNRCPPPCFSEMCTDLTRTPEKCNTYVAMCQPQCVCMDGYKRNRSGICVPIKECSFVCGVNEEPSDCKQVCPPQYCDYNPKTTACKPGPCQPGCNCIDGYLRNSSEICIPENQCPESKNCNGDKNATYRRCPNPCPPTCAAPNRPKVCKRACLAFGCQCNDGYVLQDGKCILPEECPEYKNCYGDKNATYQKCPNPCPPTCDAPDRPKVCSKACPAYGCQCNPGYILRDGKCVLPTECPGGNPCGTNKTFVGCLFNCPTNTCPRSYTCALVACSIAYPCYPGCACKKNYLKKSYNDTSCVLSSDCPPVKCTRQNEVWNPCPPPRSSEWCANATGLISRCGFSNADCQPRCVCMDGYKRNNSDVCVPINECPLVCGVNEEPSDCKQECPPQSCEYNPNTLCTAGPCRRGCNCISGYLRNSSGICVPQDQCPEYKNCYGDKNATYRRCPNPCPATCAAPNRPKVCKRACLAFGCQCNDGYVLQDGRCILVEDCPEYKNCYGDKNATYQECPNPCPPTCDAPDPPQCKKACPAYGCQCNVGYILRDGKCVLPTDCPGGDPCGKNRTFVGCPYHCPTNTCPTSDECAIVACSFGYPCYPGCACKNNYLKKNNYGTSCVLSSDCPPVKCTRQNEVWNPCPPPRSSEWCANATGLISRCGFSNADCQPRCVCMDGYKRNNSDICVPIKECPLVCGINEEPSDCKQDCPPQYCDYNPKTTPCKAGPCRPGCNCISGYLRNSSGICIPKCECPKALVCGVNEEPSDCKQECPPQYCDYNPKTTPCKPGPCQPGCNCIDGYLRNSSGICIPKCNCPKALVCGDNEEPSDCKQECPPQYCDYNPKTTPCKAGPCRPGCNCIDGYLRNSENICIPKCQCPSDDQDDK